MLLNSCPPKRHAVPGSVIFASSLSLHLMVQKALNTICCHSMTYTPDIIIVGHISAATGDLGFSHAFSKLFASDQQMMTNYVRVEKFFKPLWHLETCLRDLISNSDPLLTLFCIHPASIQPLITITK